MSRSPFAAAATVAAIALFTSSAQAGDLSGTVRYLDRALLPPGAVLTVQLEDTSRADAPSIVLAELETAIDGGPPYPFTLTYDDAAIDAKARYTLSAAVRHEGRLVMRTTTAIPALTADAPETHDLVMTRISADAPDADLLNTYWRILTLGDGPAPQVTDSTREAHLILRSGEESGFSATVGCNMFRGGLTVDGAALTFGQGMTTLMACPPPLDAAEAALRAVFTETAGWSIAGEILTLSAADGTTLLTAEAVYLQ